MKLVAFLLASILAFTSFNTFAETVHLNKADAAAMSYYLKGIGEKKASSIVKYREENGEFKKIEDIMQVKGIGKGIFEKNKANLSLTSGKTTTPEEAGKGIEETEKKTTESKQNTSIEDNAKNGEENIKKASS